MKLSCILKASTDNTYLSDRVFTSGYNNIGGGYAARVIGYTASTKTIRLIALSDHHYEDESGWSADYYHVGDTIYISTGNSDYKDFQKKTIVSVTPNTTTSGSGDTVYTTLNYIDIELDSEIDVFTDDATVSDSQTFDPTNIFYEFQANVLTDIPGCEMCRMTLTASTLKCLPGTKVAIYHENTEITAFSQSWSGDTLMITFTKSQAANPNKQFYLVSKVNGLEATTHIAIVKDSNFQYTVHMSGEHMLATGLNITANGNGHVVAGDFSTTTGIHNTNLSMNGDVSGTENDIGEGSDNIVKGINNIVSGRNNLTFGSRIFTVKDDNLLVGSMHKSITMHNIGLGFQVSFFSNGTSSSGYNFGVGNQLTFSCGNSSMIGRDLVCRADHALLVGQHGELPTLAGTLSPVTESYSSGDQEGIHYKGALAIATGDGPASSDNKKNVAVIFSKYKWKKNPAYPYGTGDSSVVCPDVVGAGSGITAATLRSKTTEDPVLLENYPLLSISGNVIVDGVVYSKKMKTVTIDDTVIEDVIPLVVDPNESSVLKIEFVGNILKTLMIMGGASDWPEGLTVRIYVKNAGAKLLFDSSNVHAIGEIPTFTKKGYDVFEMVQLDDTFYYRHLGQYSAN